MAFKFAEAYVQMSVRGVGDVLGKLRRITIAVNAVGDAAVVANTQMRQLAIAGPASRLMLAGPGRLVDRIKLIPKEIERVVPRVVKGLKPLENALERIPHFGRTNVLGVVRSFKNIKHPAQSFAASMNAVDKSVGEAFGKFQRLSPLIRNTANSAEDIQRALLSDVPRHNLVPRAIVRPNIRVREGADIAPRDAPGRIKRRVQAPVQAATESIKKLERSLFALRQGAFAEAFPKDKSGIIGIPKALQEAQAQGVFKLPEPKGPPLPITPLARMAKVATAARMATAKLAVGFGALRKASGVLSTGLGRLRGRVLSVTGGFRSMIRTGGILAGVFGALGVGLTISAMIKLAATVETLTLGFTVMTRSMSMALQMMEDINSFAARTPFEQLELAAAAKQLLIFRVENQNVLPVLRRLGDMAALSGAKILDLANIYGKVNNMQQLDFRRIKQLNQRGVASIKDFQEATGLGPVAFRKAVEAGTVTFKDFEKAMIKLTDEGGRFADGMLKLSRTLAGVWSTFTGNLKINMAKVGQSIVDAFDMKNVIRRSSKFIDEFWPRFGDRVNRVIDKVARTLKNLKPVVSGFVGTFVQGAGEVIGGLVAVQRALGDTGTAIVLLGVLAAVNPFLAIVGGIIVALGWMAKFRKESQSLSRLASKKHAEGEIQRARDKSKLDQLAELASKQKLSNEETRTAAGLVADLNNNYVDLGLSINNVTGAIEGLMAAQRQQKKDDREAKIAELEQQLSGILRDKQILKAQAQDIVDEGGTKAMLASTATGGVGGAAIGAGVGGLPGAAIGAGVGGIAGAIAGGTAAVVELEKIRDELKGKDSEEERVTRALTAAIEDRVRSPGDQTAVDDDFTEAERFTPKIQMTSLAGLANQMQTEAAKRNESFNSRTAAATERTAEAVEKFVDARAQGAKPQPHPDAMTPGVPDQQPPVPAFE